MSFKFFVKAGGKSAVKMYAAAITAINFMEKLRLILKNTPPGCFSGKAEKKERFFFLFLSQKERRKEKSSLQKEFRVCGRDQGAALDLPLSRKRPKLFIRVWFVLTVALCSRQRFSASFLLCFCNLISVLHLYIALR